MEESHLSAIIQDLVDRVRDAGHTLVVFDQEDVIPGDIIGGGKEGVVQHCQVRYHGILEPAALKTITNTDPKLLVYLLQEVELMSLGNDPIAESVLKIYGVVMLPSQKRLRSNKELYELGIVMERGLCNLLELMTIEKPPLAVRVKIMAHWARALHHLHSGDPVIVHRDVKPQNVIVKEIVRADVSGDMVDVKIKLIDLGMGQKLVEGNMSLESIVGTEGFHAPEMWAEKPYSVQADVFSLGISFMVLLFDLNAMSSLQGIMSHIHRLKENGSTGRSLYNKAKIHFHPQFAGRIPDSLETIVVSMLKKLPYRETDLQTVYARLDELSEELNLDENEDPEVSASSIKDSNSESEEEIEPVALRSIACQVTSTPVKRVSEPDFAFAVPRLPTRFATPVRGPTSTITDITPIHSPMADTPFVTSTPLDREIVVRLERHEENLTPDVKPPTPVPEKDSPWEPPKRPPSTGTDSSDESETLPPRRKRLRSRKGSQSEEEATSPTSKVSSASKAAENAEIPTPTPEAVRRSTRVTRSSRKNERKSSSNSHNDAKDNAPTGPSSNDPPPSPKSTPTSITPCFGKMTLRTRGNGRQQFQLPSGFIAEAESRSRMPTSTHCDEDDDADVVIVAEKAANRRRVRFQPIATSSTSPPKEDALERERLKFSKELNSLRVEIKKRDAEIERLRREVESLKKRLEVEHEAVKDKNDNLMRRSLPRRRATSRVRRTTKCEERVDEEDDVFEEEEEDGEENEEDQEEDQEEDEGEEDEDEEDEDEGEEERDEDEENEEENVRTKSRSSIWTRRRLRDRNCVTPPTFTPAPVRIARKRSRGGVGGENKRPTTLTTTPNSVSRKRDVRKANRRRNESNHSRFVPPSTRATRNSRASRSNTCRL